jgi:hypothetical protein
MANLIGLLALNSGAALDWVYGALASIVFVVIIAVPAAVLNSREHKKRQREQPAAPLSSSQPHAG